MKRIQISIWNAQMKDITKNINSKSIKKIKKKEDLFDSKVYALMYTALYTKFFTSLMDDE